MFYKRRSPRLARDYGAYGVHFVTITCQDRFPSFGSIDEEGRMRLSDIGELAERKWRENETYYDFVELGEYIFMPDHMHALISIKPGWKKIEDLKRNKFGTQKDGLPRVIQGFKSGVTSELKREGRFFRWQKGYYVETVFTNERQRQIEEYIRNNPKKWHEHHSK